MEVEEGDLIVLPKGCWHRFSPSEGDYVKAMRLFMDEPKWEAKGRTDEIENGEARRGYLEMLGRRGS